MFHVLTWFGASQGCPGTVFCWAPAPAHPAHSPRRTAAKGSGSVLCAPCVSLRPAAFTAHVAYIGSAKVFMHDNMRDVVKYVCTVGHHIVSCLVLLVTVRAWISSCAFKGGALPTAARVNHMTRKKKQPVPSWTPRLAKDTLLGQSAHFILCVRNVWVKWSPATHISLT